jgi:hypothetical protein
VLVVLGNFKCVCSGSLYSVGGVFSLSSCLFLWFNLWSVQALFLLILVVVLYVSIAVFLSLSVDFICSLVHILTS